MTEESRNNDMGVEIPLPPDATPGPLTLNGKPVRKPDGTPFGWHELVEGKAYHIDPLSGIITEEVGDNGTILVTPGFHERMREVGALEPRDTTLALEDDSPEAMPGDWASLPPTPTVDRKATTELTKELLKVMRAHCLGSPMTTNTNLEILNALAFAVAVLIASGKQVSDEHANVALEFFTAALYQQVKHILTIHADENIFDKMMRGSPPEGSDPSWGDR